MRLKKFIAILLIMIILVPAGISSAENIADSQLDEYRGAFDLYNDVIRYNRYLAEYSNIPRPDTSYIIPGSSYTSTEGMDVFKYDYFEGVSDSVFTGDNGYITWTVNVEQAGLYNMSIRYFPVPGTSAAIQRSIFINDELPFAEAALVEFTRIWVDLTHDFEKDAAGNMLRPGQREAPVWTERPFRDAQGYHTEPLLFYLEEGTNTITLLSIREPMLIEEITLYQHESPPAYTEYLAQKKAAGSSATENKFKTILAQKASTKSDPMLYPYTDRSDPTLTPHSNSALVLNTIGGGNWNKSGQWIEWEFEVEEAGLYHIGYNVLQNTRRGSLVFRKIYINGEVPFEEMQYVEFPFMQRWRQEVLGGDDPYLFWLDKGVNTIKMEVTLGTMAEYIDEMQDIIRNLHQMYQQVAGLTGGEPDLYRDYQIARTLPHMPEAIRENHERLTVLAAHLEELVGNRGDIGAFVNAVLVQMNFMVRDVETMPRYLKPFWDSIAGLQTWITAVTDNPVSLDNIYVFSPGENKPVLRNGFFARLWNELLNLFYSFIIDYNTIGSLNKDDHQRHITVWVGTGRDQANTLKQMINNDFTPKTGIDVTLMLVALDSLLPSVFSGQAPDIAMQLGLDVPMNYGMRGALADLAQFPDFDEITERFYPSAMVPLMYDGRAFGLPETQTFPMLFYRKDILADLGLAVPQTWDDVRDSLLTLEDNNMFFGLRMYEPWVYGMFLFQHGGEYYVDNGRASGLDSPEGINAFKEYTSLYLEYGFVKVFDFVTRLRTGEMPMGIADYSLYNTLQVSAPEIKGLWTFTTVPGTVQPDGSINRAVPSGGLATVMLEQSKDKESSWEFLKWWTSEDVQVQYGLEMEGLMGPAARYATANRTAIWRLPWPAQDAAILRQQVQYVRGIPQVPGGYFTDRNIINMTSAVVDSMTMDARDAIIDYVQNINNEINQKRREFGLD